MKLIGQAVPRVDGRDKVLGRTIYTGDVSLPGMVHAVLVHATISLGRVTAIEVDRASARQGVLEILTPFTCPALGPLPSDIIRVLPSERRPPLSDLQVEYAGQHLALVVAESLVQAQCAAASLRVSYERLPSLSHVSESKPVTPNTAPKEDTDHHRVRDGSYLPDHFTKMEAEKLQYSRGQSKDSPHTVAGTHHTPVEHHHPIELSSTVASWSNGCLTVYDSTRWLVGSRKTLAAYLDLPKEKIRVLCPYVGGAFG